MSTTAVKTAVAPNEPNREIKFRVWLKPTEKMVYRPAFQIYPSGNIEAEGYGNDDHFGNDIVVMQYTGLKDAKGREIYEGDIIRFYILEGEIECKYEVKFAGGMFYITDGQPLGLTLFLADGAEVIGNVKENPELLDD